MTKTAPHQHAGNTGNDLLLRLERLEAAVFDDRPADARKSHSGKSGGTLPERILELREDGFFSAAKTPTEVRSELAPKYHCELDRVAMALLRLQRRRELRKTTKVSDGKKSNAYVW